jgi:tetratricopeptide (TPR) repeat protein
MEVMQYGSANSRWCKCHRLVRSFLLSLMLALGLLAGSIEAGQGTRPRKKAPPPKPHTTAPASETALTPREALDRARTAATQPERIDLLEKFLRIYGSDALVGEARQLLMREYALKGEQMLREANPQAAMQAFKNVFRVTPAIISDKVFGQYIFSLPMAMNAFGYRIESADLMRSFETRFADNSNRLIEIGFFYVQIEAPLEAIRVLDRAVQLAPQDHRAHNSLGTAYLINLRLDEAAAEFQRALELDARDEYANLNLGNLARAANDFEGAIKYYRRQLAIKADDAEPHGGLAIAMLALGRDEEATPEIKRAIELAPADYRFLVQLAHFYVTRRKAALARPLIEQALKIEPRYGWALLTKANVDMLDGRYGDALGTLIGAQAQASFPTLTFELVKTLMALDGYDQALEVMSKAFTINDTGEFETLLGGAIRARSPRLDNLLERERHAALYLNDNPTTSLQYRLAEALGKIDYYSKTALAARKPDQPAAPRRRAPGKAPAPSGARANEQDGLSGVTRPRRSTDNSTELSAGNDAGLPGMSELLRAITTFTTLDDGRQPFRMVWVARKLTENNLALDAAVQLARRAITMADAATEPAGSMRDAPLLDREGRRAVFMGRAYDALGWVLLRKGDTASAVQNLSKSVEIYPECAERRAVLWHLAVATQESGNEQRALDLYIASYDPNLPASTVRRTQIESLYKKLKGSLTGLDEKLRRP